MSRATRCRQWESKHRSDESVIFKHQSILKLFRLCEQATDRVSMDSSVISRQPPITRVSRLGQDLAKEKMDVSPALKQSKILSEVKEEEEASAILETPISPILEHLLRSKNLMWRHPSASTERPESVMLLHPANPSSSKCRQFLEREWRRLSVTDLHPATCKLLKLRQPDEMDVNPLLVSFRQLETSKDWRERRPPAKAINPMSEMPEEQQGSHNEIGSGKYLMQR